MFAQAPLFARWIQTRAFAITGRTRPESEVGAVGTWSRTLGATRNVVGAVVAVPAARRNCVGDAALTATATCPSFGFTVPAERQTPAPTARCSTRTAPR